MYWPVIIQSRMPALCRVQKRTVCLSTADTPSSSNRFLYLLPHQQYCCLVSFRYHTFGDAVLGSTARRIRIQSSAVTGSPFDHCASLRKWNANVLLSSVSQDSATRSNVAIAILRSLSGKQVVECTCLSRGLQPLPGSGVPATIIRAHQIICCFAGGSAGNVSLGAAVTEIKGVNRDEMK